MREVNGPAMAYFIAPDGENRYYREMLFVSHHKIILEAYAAEFMRQLKCAFIDTSDVDPVIFWRIRPEWNYDH